MEIIRLKPIFKNKIWGGDRINKEYNYNVDSNNIGEVWCISGECIVTNGNYKGMKLLELYNTHKELFGNLDYDKFPLITKIIDAKDDLSIQVHPDDEYAYINENKSLGKEECWYILDTKPDTKIIIGHNAKTKNELIDMINNHRWHDLIREIPIKKGDFFMIEPGTVHAIKGGTLILETQENSDITYRLYDYDRLDNGTLRPLHINKSIDVIKVPYKDIIPKKDLNITINKNMYQYATCDKFTLWKLDVKGSSEIIQDQACMLCTVIEGEGYINNEYIKKGDHFIIPYGYGKAILHGNFETMISSPKQLIKK